MDLEQAVDVCIQKRQEFEQALKELITHHQILILALRTRGVKTGKGGYIGEAIPRNVPASQAS